MGIQRREVLTWANLKQNASDNNIRSGFRGDCFCGYVNATIHYTFIQHVIFQHKDINQYLLTKNIWVALFM